MPFITPHKNGHEQDAYVESAGQCDMTVQETEDFFVAGFLRPLAPRKDEHEERSNSLEQQGR
jgi:hypothetical protein